MEESKKLELSSFDKVYFDVIIQVYKLEALFVVQKGDKIDIEFKLSEEKYLNIYAILFLLCIPLQKGQVSIEIGDEFIDYMDFLDIKDKKHLCFDDMFDQILLKIEKFPNTIHATVDFKKLKENQKNAFRDIVFLQALCGGQDPIEEILQKINGPLTIKNILSYGKNDLDKGIIINGKKYLFLRKKQGNHTKPVIIDSNKKEYSKEGGYTKYRDENPFVGEYQGLDSNFCEFDTAFILGSLAKILQENPSYSVQDAMNDFFNKDKKPLKTEQFMAEIINKNNPTLNIGINSEKSSIQEEEKLLELNNVSHKNKFDENNFMPKEQNYDKEEVPLKLESLENNNNNCCNSCWQ